MKPDNVRKSVIAAAAMLAGCLAGVACMGMVLFGLGHVLNIISPAAPAAPQAETLRVEYMPEVVQVIIASGDVADNRPFVKVPTRIDIFQR